MVGMGASPCYDGVLIFDCGRSRTLAITLTKHGLLPVPTIFDRNGGRPCHYFLNLNSGMMLSVVMSSYNLSRLSGSDFKNGFILSP